MNLSSASGEAQVAAEEGQALRDRGHEVTHMEFTLAAGESPRRASLAVDALTGRRAADTLRDTVAGEPFDVIHVHGNIPSVGTAAYAVAARAGVACFQTLHNYRHVCIEGGLYRDGAPCRSCVDSSQLRGIQHRCVNASLAQSLVLSAAALQTRRWWNEVRFLAVSDFVRSLYVDAGLPADRISTKYNAVPRVGGVGIGAPGIDGPHPGRPLALFVGRQTRSKGIDLFARLAYTTPDVRFVAVGDLDPTTHIEQPPNLEQRPAVERDALAELYRCADVVVVPSRSPESFGRVAVEALQHGVPVLARDVGALPEILGHGRFGTLLATDETSAWTDALRSCLGGSGRTPDGEACRSHLEQFTVGATVDMLEAHYARWASRPRTTGG